MKFVTDSPGPLTNGWGIVPEGSVMTPAVDSSERAGRGLYQCKYGSKRRAASAAIEVDAGKLTDTPTCVFVSELSCKTIKPTFEELD